MLKLSLEELSALNVVLNTISVANEFATQWKT